MHVDFLFVMHLLLLSVSFSKHVETEIAAARKKTEKRTCSSIQTLFRCCLNCLFLILVDCYNVITTDYS